MRSAALTVSHNAPRSQHPNKNEGHTKSRPNIYIFTARCTLVQSAVLRSHIVCLSVCPSVCPSVTLVDCDHIG